MELEKKLNNRSTQFLRKRIITLTFPLGMFVNSLTFPRTLPVLKGIMNNGKE